MAVHLSQLKKINVMKTNVKNTKKRANFKSTIKNLFIGITFCSSFNATAQTNNNPTIAVSIPSVQGINIPPKTCSKMMYLELVKLNQYNVYNEFDISEVVNSNPTFQKECFGINCLTTLGKALKVDFIASCSFDRLGNKIIISLKIIDINKGVIHKTSFKEFGNQEEELQRMIELTLREMMGLENVKETESQLSFKNDVITSNNVGRINNSGPRIGYAYVTGSLSEFANRSEDEGGLDVFPAFSMIGYQFEKQYIGTENFSALFETIINVSGLEQGHFIPSVSLLNGFRFGKSGFEIAFGPSFGLQQTSKGFFDTNNEYGQGANRYWTENEYANYASKLADSSNNYTAPASSYKSATFLDTRGTTSVSTRWLMGIGRTFKSGSLNIPVNIFYSSLKKGGMLGLSVGFNVVKRKEKLNYSI